MSNRPTIYVRITGGDVAHVQSDDPALQGLRVVLIDEDLDLLSPDAEPVELPLLDNSGSFEARVHECEVTIPDFDVSAVDAYLDTPLEDEVNHAIEAWHQSAGQLEVCAWLGWTQAEYAAFVADSSSIPARPLPPAILEASRGAAAQSAFEAYDFSPYSLVDHSGWELTTGTDERSRPVYLAGDDEDAPTTPCRFVVDFLQGRSIVREASCYDPRGQIIGSMGD